jgi:MFS superfamily sulfate permease-like transporter
VRYIEQFGSPAIDIGGIVGGALGGSPLQVSGPRLTRVLGSVPLRASVTLHIAVSYLDHAAQQAITDWQQQHHATGGKVHIDGVLEHGHSTRILQW